jgi:hypothetical protein
MNSTPGLQYLKIGRALLAMGPIAPHATQEVAFKNDTMRASLKYHDHPGPDMGHCSGCAYFIPGEADVSLGRCKLMWGDTEVSPLGYCSGWHSAD